MGDYQAIYISPGDRIPWPAATGKIEAGTVIELANGGVGVATQPIEQDEMGTINIAGIHEFRKVMLAMLPGAPLYWDPTGDPVDGPAGSGAATTTSAPGLNSIGLVADGVLNSDPMVKGVVVQPSSPGT